MWAVAVTIKFITHVALPGSSLRGLAMRRAYIYPHRSVRSWQPTSGRVVLSLVTAALLIASVALWNGRLFGFHNQLCVGILRLSAVPVDGVRMVDLFPGLSPAPVPDTSVVRFESRPELYGVTLCIALLALLVLQRFFPLARGFILFLMALLVVSAVVVVFFPGEQFGAVELGQIWLRGESLVWLLLPLFSAAMITLLHPAAILGIFWAVLVQLYALVWSAVRLAFLIGLMHFSGILFVPLLWFSLGLLADMVYLMVFYSIAIHWVTSRKWGRYAQ